MREIKFRAWWQHDKYNPDGAMYGVGAVDWTKPDFGEPERELCQHPTQVALVDYPYEVGTYQKLGWNENCTLMQYTGLKDKNGVEIYEGDVIRAKHDDGRYDIGNIVYGSKGAFCLHLSNVGTGIKTPLLNYIHGIMFAEFDFEVIGNIYEHSHLLEANNDQL